MERCFTQEERVLQGGTLRTVNGNNHAEIKETCDQLATNFRRTICDLVRSRSWFEIQDFQTALKTYVGRNNKNLHKLMEYAETFRVDKKIREYMEVML